MLATAHARAQDSGSSTIGSCSGTTMPGSEVVALAAEALPQRWIVKDGSPVNVTQNRRPDNLNPWGISFSDCMDDMRVDFSLTVAGFSATDDAHVEVWAGSGADCSVDANRNPTSAGVSHACWRVANPMQPMVVGSSPLAVTASIYARDALRYEQPPTQSDAAQSYDASFHSSSNGVQACQVQTSDAAVTINIYFLALNSAEHVVGQPGCYALGTDLVGPPPPPQVSAQAGDTLLSVSWTSPGNAPDLIGFDVWSDPPAGGTKSSSSLAGCSCSMAPGSQATEDTPDDVEVSPAISDAAGVEDAESGAPDGAPEADGSADSAVDGAPRDASADGDASAATDAGAPSDAGTDGDAGSPATDAATCRSENLTGFSTVVDNGGISQINAKFLANAFPGSTPPSSGSPLTLTGMANGKNYAVVVTSTDAFGNDGPASAPSCAVPQAVSDFWQTYAGDNGSVATCAFESGGRGSGDLVVPGLLLAVAAALLRRRAT